MPIYKRFSFWLVSFVILGIAIFALNRTLRPIEVKAARVERGDLVVTVTATSAGTIKADEEVMLTAQRPGRISKLLIKEGETVKAGELVAELDPKEALYNLQMSQSALNRKKAILDGLKAAYSPLSVDVESNIDKAKANLLEAEKKLKRLMDLKKKGYVSQMELDVAQRDYEVSKAAYESAIAGREHLKAKAEEIKAQYAAVAEAENSLLLAKLNYDYSFIRSPISGVVTSVPVKVGETVTKGTLIASIVSMDSLYIEAPIDEADIANVSIGQKVNISMDAYPGRVFEGEVYMISPVVLGKRLEVRTFEIRVRFKEKGIIIRPGMSADVEVIVGSVKNALIVPSQAIIEEGGRKFVFVKSGSRAKLVPVKTGLSNWEFTEILSELKEGDLVAINPDTPGLRDGVRVRWK